MIYPLEGYHYQFLAQTQEFLDASLPSDLAAAASLLALALPLCRERCVQRLRQWRQGTLPQRRLGAGHGTGGTRGCRVRAGNGLKHLERYKKIWKVEVTAMKRYEKLRWNGFETIRKSGFCQQRWWFVSLPNGWFKPSQAKTKPSNVGI